MPKIIEIAIVQSTQKLVVSDLIPKSEAYELAVEYIQNSAGSASELWDFRTVSFKDATKEDIEQHSPMCYTKHLLEEYDNPLPEAELGIRRKALEQLKVLRKDSFTLAKKIYETKRDVPTSVGFNKFCHLYHDTEKFFNPNDPAFDLIVAGEKVKELTKFISENL